MDGTSLPCLFYCFLHLRPAVTKICNGFPGKMILTKSAVDDSVAEETTHIRLTQNPFDNQQITRDPCGLRLGA